MEVERCEGRGREICEPIATVGEEPFSFCRLNTRLTAEAAKQGKGHSARFLADVVIMLAYHSHCYSSRLGRNRRSSRSHPATTTTTASAGEDRHE